MGARSSPRTSKMSRDQQAADRALCEIARIMRLRAQAFRKKLKSCEKKSKKK
jgi:hypothetical protein